MCIPVDSLIWALAARIRDDGYVATQGDLRALLGSGCERSRVRAILEQGARDHPGRPFAEALEALASAAS